MKCPLVSIIILNWNGKKLLKDCLSSLFKLTSYPNYKVIVVDNGSTDGSVEYVKKHFPKADILPLDKNYGFSKGNNEGIKYALKKYNPKYILLLNNDTEIIQKDWLTKMVEVAESDKKIGIVGCSLLFPDRTLQHAGMRRFSELILPSYIHRLSFQKVQNNFRIILVALGACFMIKKSVIDKIGKLDEIYTPASYEDLDYFVRARKAGFLAVCAHNVKIIHKVSLSWKKIFDLDRYKLITRNYFIFLLKHFRRYLFLGFLLRIIISFLDKADDLEPISLFNLRLRKLAPKRILITFWALVDALKLVKSKRNYLM